MVLVSINYGQMRGQGDKGLAIVMCKGGGGGRFGKYIVDDSTVDSTTLSNPFLSSIIGDAPPLYILLHGRRLSSRPTGFISTFGKLHISGSLERLLGVYNTILLSRHFVRIYPSMSINYPVWM